MHDEEDVFPSTLGLIRTLPGIAENEETLDRIKNLEETVAKLELQIRDLLDSMAAGVTALKEMRDAGKKAKE